MEVDEEYFQAISGQLREEYVPMVEFINSDDFKAELEKSGSVHTPKFSSEIFEQCFKRSYNVEFIMKTNLK